MVAASDFTVELVQATAYAASDPLSPPRVLRHALAAWSNLYDGTPISLPLPPGAPVEIPSVILASQDGTQRIEIAPSRVNIFVTRPIDEETLQVVNIYPDLSERLIDIFENEGIAIGRLAAVVHQAASVDAPAQALARQYFRDQWLVAPLNRPESLELHAHKIFDLRPDLPVNSWMRLRTGERIPTSEPVIAAEQDINTPEEQRAASNFDRDSTAEFFRLVTAELSTILRLYFPEDPIPQEGGG